MKIITISSMFPSKALPNHAIFVKNRIQRIAKLCEVKIIVPIPYFPLVNRHRHYSFRKFIPHSDIIGGMEVYYPRFLSIPRILKPLDGIFLFLSCLLFIKIKLKRYPFDLIDAHLAFPDGFGAVLLGKYFNKPVTITLRGHDINNLPKYPVRFRQIQYVLNQAANIFSVAKALKKAAGKFGIQESKIMVSSNGVDIEKFFPVDMMKMRKQLHLPTDKKIVVSVGNLVERKGFHVLLQALKLTVDHRRNDVHVIIVGGPGEEGDYSEILTKMIRDLDLGEHVTMAGVQNNSKLYQWYNAADISCLASSKEGWANVLLESLACGKPVVATNVWGTPEVLSSSEYGILTERNPEALSNAIYKALETDWKTEEIVSYARQHTWDSVAEKVIDRFQAIAKTK